MNGSMGLLDLVFQRTKVSANEKKREHTATLPPLARSVTLSASFHISLLG